MKSNDYIFTLSPLKLAMRDNNEDQSHLCNSLNAMYGLFTKLGQLNDNSYIPIRSNTLYTAGLYMERAQNLITYLQNELRNLKGEQ